MLTRSRPHPDRFVDPDRFEFFADPFSPTDDFEVAVELKAFSELRTLLGITDSSLRRYDRAEIRSFVRSVAQDIERFETHLRTHNQGHPPEKADACPSVLDPLVIDLTASIHDMAVRTGVLQECIGSAPRVIDRSFAATYLQQRLLQS